jgi:hypothetical protein
MNKPTLVFQGPIFTRSGYGDHARDIYEAYLKWISMMLKLYQPVGEIPHKIKLTKQRNLVEKFLGKCNYTN